MSKKAELVTKKRSLGFSEKNRGVIPSVAAPGVTHSSDATAHVTSDVIMTSLAPSSSQAIRGAFHSPAPVRLSLATSYER